MHLNRFLVSRCARVRVCTRCQRITWTRIPRRPGCEFKVFSLSLLILNEPIFSDAVTDTARKRTINPDLVSMEPMAYFTLLSLKRILHFCIYLFGKLISQIYALMDGHVGTLLLRGEGGGR